MSERNGVLLVDKPRGPTSHDVVGIARRSLRMRRIGHTGTLDPFASGLLLLCLGPATRLSEYLTSLAKRYTAVVRLGVATDTDDLTGEVLTTSEGWRELGLARVEAELREQVGTILQRPPAYSAKKVRGERMYEAARRGEAVQVEPVPVTIEAIRVTRFDAPDVELEVECGSGTYIRAIARDLGEALGVGGHLTELRRTRVGEFSVEEALPLEALDDDVAVGAALRTPARALAHLPAVTLDDEAAGAIRHGRAVADVEPGGESGPLALLSAEQELLAVGERSGGTIRPRKVFA